MHDVGIIVWAAIVVIGMVASIVSTARKAAGPAPRPSVRLQRPAPAPQRPVPAPQWPPQAPQWPPSGALQWPPQPQPVPVASPKPKPPSPVPRAAQAVPRPPSQPSEHDFPVPSRRRRGIFGDAAGLRRAVIASEVLGKPVALRDE